MIYQLEGDVYRLAFLLGGSPEYRAFIADRPIAATRGTLVGRVGVERPGTVQIDDVLADPAYEWHQASELSGQRTMLGVPMLAAERVVGVILLWRYEVDRLTSAPLGSSARLRRRERLRFKTCIWCSSSSDAKRSWRARSVSFALWARSARLSARAWSLSAF